MTDFYPILPPQSDLIPHLPQIIAVLQHHSVSALRISAPEKRSASQLDALIEACHLHDVALIVELSAENLTDSKDFLQKIDGFHLKDASLLEKLISFLPKKYTQQIGVTASDLDDAMQAGETGADYISFSPLLSEQIALWNRITELPCVAEPLEEEAHILSALQAKADFLGFSLKLNDSDALFLQNLEKLTDSLQQNG